MPSTSYPPYPPGVSYDPSVTLGARRLVMEMPHLILHDRHGTVAPVYGAVAPVANLRSGDLLLYRADPHVEDMAIEAFTNSVWIHAAMLVWNGEEGRWDIAETVLWHGGRRQKLYDSVLKHPGHWDIFQANPEDRWPEFNRRAAVAKMDEFMGRPYGWRGLVRDGATHLPVLSAIFHRDIQEGDDDGDRPFCSQAYVLAVRAGGADPVPNRPACYVEPVHLAQSPFFEYLGTLWPGEEESGG